MANSSPNRQATPDFHTQNWGSLHSLAQHPETAWPNFAAQGADFWSTELYLICWFLWFAVTDFLIQLLNHCWIFLCQWLVNLVTVSCYLIYLQASAHSCSSWGLQPIWLWNAMKLERLHTSSHVMSCHEVLWELKTSTNCSHGPFCKRHIFPYWENYVQVLRIFRIAALSSTPTAVASTLPLALAVFDLKKPNLSVSDSSQAS